MTAAVEFSMPVALFGLSFFFTEHACPQAGIPQYHVFNLLEAQKEAAAELPACINMPSFDAVQLTCGKRPDLLRNKAVVRNR